MLTFFTDPYPDELLISALSRYHYYIGNYINDDTNFELFGNKNVNFSKFLIADLENLVKKLSSEYSVDELINKHTTKKYYSLFQDNDYSFNEYYIDNENKRYRESYDDIFLCLKKKLYYCPVCALEDINSYGEAYFHREHQLEGVIACRKHRVKLKVYNQKPVWKRVDDYNIFNRYKINFDKNDEMIESKFDEIFNIANLAYELINCKFNSIPNSKHLFKEYYRDILWQKGYINNKRIYNIDLLKKELDEFYKVSVIENMDKYVFIDRLLKYFTLIACDISLSIHPFWHLVIMNFLELNIEMIENNIMSYYSPFKSMLNGKTIGTCFNKYCNYFGQPAINSIYYSKNHHNDDLNNIKGIFKCRKCGFSYSVNSKDFNWRNNKVDIIDYGHLWMENLKILAFEYNFNVKRIANKMSCTSEIIKLQLNDINVHNDN